MQATFNNTIITMPTPRVTGFLVERGFARVPRTRKGTPFAAQRGVDDGGVKAKEVGLRIVDVKSWSWVGPRINIRALATSGLEVRAIKDSTPIPHNGCRPPKRRV